MADRPQVLLFTDDPCAGGVAHYNHAILCNLTAHGFRVTCVQTQVDTPLVRRQAEVGVRHRWLGYDTLYDLRRQLADTAGTRAIIQDERPDLVFCSNGCPLSQLAARRAALEMDVPYLVVEGYVAPDMVDQVASYLPELAHQYGRARAVVAVSAENLRLLHERFGLPRGHGQVIHYGRPARFFVPSDPETRRRLRGEQGIPDDAVLCFTAARLEPVKGYRHQLEAARRIQDVPGGRRLYFVWAGGGLAARPANRRGGPITSAGPGQSTGPALGRG
jgi:glycosyltransferase involved in cell wall biosynthesis